MPRWPLLFITLFLAIALGMLSIAPPAPRGLDSPKDQFSSARAMKDVSIIAKEPHPTGSKENADVRTYLVERLTSLGMDVSVHQTKLDETALAQLQKWTGEEIVEQPIFNVIGVLPGEDRSKPALLLMAHHDTVWGSPGAADDTIGLASILEIARALKERGRSNRDLIVLFTDAEELRISGSKNFFKTHPLRGRIGTVINFESRGGGGIVSMFETSAENGDAIKVFARSVREPSVSSLSAFVYSIAPNYSDLTPAMENGYIGYNFVNLGKPQYYHSPKIDAEALDQRTLQHMGSQGLDLAQALMSANEVATKQPNMTFFDFFGLFTIIYAPFWGWVFLVIGAIFYGISIKGKTRPRDIFDGCLRMLSVFIIGGALLFALNILSGGGGSANYYDRLAAISKLEWLVCIFCLSLFLALFGRKTLSENGRFGAAIPLFILGFLGQIYAPTATYFISLPLLLCAIASLTMRRWPDKVIGLVVSIPLTAIVLGYMLSLGHLLMLGVGPDMLAAIILPAAIATLAILPFYPSPSRHTGSTLAISVFALSVGVSLWIRFDPIASTVPLY